MKKVFLLMVTVALMAACEKSDSFSDLTIEDDLTLKSVDETGNGAPSGAHYNLNIIGVKNKKDASMTEGEGHRIFVLLDKEGVKDNTKIKLTEAPEGESFKVLDGNGTDGNGAMFQLPNPDPDGITSYTVWARPLGTPGGSAELVPCAIYVYEMTDTDGNVVYDENGEPVLIEEEVCSETILDVYRGTGREKFRDVSWELLWLHFSNDYTLEDGTVIPAGNYSLFDEILQQYFWSYDNNGLKLLQLRFYENTEV